MSIETCTTCGSSWDASVQARCPDCQARAWAQTPDLVRPKHDPGSVTWVQPDFRSVITPEFTRGSSTELLHIACTGTVFRSVKFAGKLCVFAPAPAGTGAGSAILPGGSAPSYSLDGYLIADPTGSAHIYAQDQTRFSQEVSAGSYVPMPRCAAGSCDNLALPTGTWCVQHHRP